MSNLNELMDKFSEIRQFALHAGMHADINISATVSLKGNTTFVKPATVHVEIYDDLSIENELIFMVKQMKGI
ncbi:MAG: hypothetical protein ACI9TY_001776 [Alphaproteobacteria bacterium]|jgi:hypothetical protein